MRPGLLALGFGLVTLGWMLLAPPSYGPDEPAHFIKAVGLARGDMLGKPILPGEVISTKAQTAGGDQSLRALARAFDVPANLAVPQQWVCEVASDSASAGCLLQPTTSPPTARQLSYVGAYPPWAYALPGLLAQLGGDPATALAWARLGNLLTCMALIVAAVFLVWDGRPRSLLGVLAAVSPMALFSAAVLNPSGPEIAAGICLGAALVRISRAPSKPTRAWWAVAAAAVCLALARPLGPLVLLFYGLFFVGVVGRAPAVAAVRASARQVVPGAVAVLLAMAAWATWQVLVQPHPIHPEGSFLGRLGLSVVLLAQSLGETMGVFGWNGELMPRYAYLVGGLMVILLFYLGTSVATRRQRWLLDGILVGSALLTIAISLFILLPTGFLIEGRYILPFVAAFPLYAAEVLNQNWEKLSGRRQRLVVAVLALGCPLLLELGWYTIGHRAAVGLNGPVNFIGRAQWEPAAGWLLPTAISILGPLCCALAVAWPRTRSHTAPA